MEKPTGALTDSAKEVKKEMDTAYLELRDVREELGGSIISLANDIIKGIASPEKMIDFRIQLAEIRSTLIADAGLTERQKTIRERFIAKLEPVVIQTKQALPSQLDAPAQSLS